MKLFYLKQPNENGINIADYETWENESLPLGNGYFGASIFGYTNCERIQITENSLCNPFVSDSKHPGFNFGLQSFCDIFIELNHENYENYQRELKLDDATFSCHYSLKGHLVKRECFLSRPDKILVYKISSKNHLLSAKISLKIPYLGTEKVNGINLTRTGKVQLINNTIVCSGNLNFYNIDYCGVLKVKTTDGEISYGKECLEIKNAHEILIFFSCKTNYELKESVFISKDNRNKLSKNEELINEVISTVEIASKKTFNHLYQTHIKDYSKIYNRVELSIGEKDKLPTDILLKNYKNGIPSHYLEALLFQYGRYLLICSSRRGSLPSNLQGIWSAYKSSPWSAGYWHNINVQMNYWLSGPCNLNDLFLSYSDYAQAYYKEAKANASKYIKELYPEKYEENNNGWVVGTGCWPYKVEELQTCSHSGPGTGAFTSLLFWDYYSFTQDVKCLKNVAYPFLYEMSRFLYKTLEKIDDSYLVKHSASPENVKKEDSEWNDYFHCSGCAFDQQMVYENFSKTIEASKILGIKNDELIEKLDKVLPYLDPVIIGESGQVKEYREEKYYGDIGEKHHRHISQLVGLYPGTIINQNNMNYLNAAKVTLINRGDLSTGWATMHRLCLWSRVKDGNHCYKIIKNFIANKVLNNLWDTHPPSKLMETLAILQELQKCLYSLMKIT